MKIDKKTEEDLRLVFTGTILSFAALQMFCEDNNLPEFAIRIKSNAQIYDTIRFDLMEDLGLIDKGDIPVTTTSKREQAVLKLWQDLEMHAGFSEAEVAKAQKSIKTMAKAAKQLSDTFESLGTFMRSCEETAATCVDLMHELDEEKDAPIPYSAVNPPPRARKKTK